MRPVKPLLRMVNFACWLTDIALIAYLIYGGDILLVVAIILASFAFAWLIQRSAG